VSQKEKDIYWEEFQFYIILLLQYQHFSTENIICLWMYDWIEGSISWYRLMQPQFVYIFVMSDGLKITLLVETCHHT